MVATKKWKMFENLVAKVQADLASDAIVKINQLIMGKISERKRQVDILVQKNIGNYNVNIIIECKDFKKPLNVKQVEATIGLMKDVGADIGVIVAANGFSKAALTVGQKAGLKLYRLIDTGDHDWKVNIRIPALCIIHNLRQFNYIINYLDFGEGKIPADHSMMLYDINQEEIGLPETIIIDWWLERQEIELDEGYYENFEFIKDEVFLLIQGKLLPIKITGNFDIHNLIYFKKWPLTQMSGLEDQVDKRIQTRSFTLNEFSIEDLNLNWTKLKTLDEIPVKPIITMHLRGYGQPD